MLTNVTASGNHATGVGGGMYNLMGTPEVRNSVFWNNRDTTGTGTQSASIFTSGWIYPSVSYSLVQGSGGSGAGWDGNVGTDGGNNIDADPHFYTPVNPAAAPTTAGELRIYWSGAAIDAGDNALNDTTEDLGGLPRKSDGNADGTDVIDMGAHEATKPYRQFVPLAFRQ